MPVACAPLEPLSSPARSRCCSLFRHDLTSRARVGSRLLCRAIAAVAAFVQQPVRPPASAVLASLVQGRMVGPGGRLPGGSPTTAAGLIILPLPCAAPCCSVNGGLHRTGLTSLRDARRVRSAQGRRRSSCAELDARGTRCTRCRQPDVDAAELHLAAATAWCNGGPGPKLAVYSQTQPAKRPSSGQATLRCCFPSATSSAGNEKATQRDLYANA